MRNAFKKDRRTSSDFISLFKPIGDVDSNIFFAGGYLNGVALFQQNTSLSVGSTAIYLTSLLYHQLNPALCSAPAPSVHSEFGSTRVLFCCVPSVYSIVHFT